MSQDIAERFARETARHRMTVLHDDGLYRHLRFQEMHLCNDAEWRPTSSFYWFDLITWPGSLTIKGDVGTYTFSRELDMFGFFHAKYGINPQYWAEKVPQETRTKSYSEERFREQVMEDAAQAEAEFPGLTAALELNVFGDRAWLEGWDTASEEGARQVLASYGFGDTWAAECTCGESAEGFTDESDAIRWRSGHITADNARARHKASDSKVEGFRFTDTWEWDLGDYDWTFLWCCHAIVWGIAEYGKQAEVLKPAPATPLSWIRKQAPADTPAATVLVAGGVL